MIKIVSIDRLVTFHIKQIKPESIKFYKNIAELCKMKYIGHNKGCPNYGNSLMCPFDWKDQKRIGKKLIEKAYRMGWNGLKDELPYYLIFSPYCETYITYFNKIHLVYGILDFKTYKERMKTEYKEKLEYWTESRIKCVLYWQTPMKIKVHKILNNFLRRFDNDKKIIMGCGSGLKEYFSMESCGINVIVTLKNNGIYIEPKPINKIILCSLVGFKE